MVEASVESLAIADVKVLTPRKFSDHRGYFCETYSTATLPNLGFVQDNVSMSAQAGTVRGLHFQEPPFAQAKLVTVLRGAIFDVAVDIRKNSPTFGHWVGVELTGETLKQLLVPAGFAHGFCTLVPDTLVFYKVDAHYAPAHDRGLRWNDPAIGIPWPIAAEKAVVSDKDRQQPLLAELKTPFTFAGARTSTPS
ncbi:MAG: dTDP-4-dehydrorhamnose 3,5-epimerase [Alphaproteobacteria bacterium]